MAPGFLRTIHALALPALEVARLEAIAALPDTVRWDHTEIVRARQSVETWAAAEWQYLKRNDRPDPTTIQAFRILAAIDKFKTEVEGAEGEGKALGREADRVANGLPAQDLSLGKMR